MVEIEKMLSDGVFKNDRDYDNNNEDYVSYNSSDSLNDFPFCLNNEHANNDLSPEDYSNIYFINTPNIFEKNNIKDQNINNNSNSMTNTKPTAKKYPKIVGKIFNIIKVNKKMGRLVKHSRLRFDTVKHNKFSEDNIIRKIKANCHEKFFNYINKEYGEYFKKKHRVKKMIKLIQRISPSESRKIKKEDNIKWFSMKLKDVFSVDLSTKCSKYDSDYNKKQIEILYQKGEATKVIDILEKKVKDIYTIYSKDIPVEGFETLKDDLDVIKKKMEENGEEDIDIYLESYKRTAQNLENIFLSKKPRNNKGKIKDKIF